MTSIGPLIGFSTSSIPVKIGPRMLLKNPPRSRPTLSKRTMGALPVGLLLSKCQARWKSAPIIGKPTPSPKPPLSRILTFA